MLRLHLKYAELGVYLTNWIKEYNPLPNPDNNKYEILKKVVVYIGNSGSMLVTRAFTFQEVREWQLMNVTKERKLDKKIVTKRTHESDSMDETDGKNEADRKYQMNGWKAANQTMQNLSKEYQLDVKSYNGHGYNCRND